jgi:hypothetical protein
MARSTSTEQGRESDPDRSVRAAESFLENWIEHVERQRAKTAIHGPDVDPAPPAVAARAAPTPGTTKESDFVALVAERGRFRHLGTVAFRGPCAPPREALPELGVDDVDAKALEFVAAWFGAPFDAVNVQLRGDRALSWGFWHLSGEGLADSLARWREHDRASFDACLGVTGMGVALEADASGKVAVANLCYRDEARGRVVHGEAAEALVTIDRSLVSALARSGRARAAQLAQIESVVVRALRPAVGFPLPTAGIPLGDALRDTRGRAGLFYTSLCFGAGGVEHLAAEVDRACRAGQRPGADALLAAFAERVRRTSAAAHAHHLLRIISSPELGS